MSEAKIITYQLHLDDFRFLGNTNVIDGSSDFGAIWEDFFQKGGYEPILPYAVDKSPINIWFHDQMGRMIYFQGLFVQGVDHAPPGYTLMDFSGGDYLAVTTEWMETNEEAVGDAGNGRCNQYADTAAPPAGYARLSEAEAVIFRIEKENANTPQGSRYEVWAPIQKQPFNNRNIKNTKMEEPNMEKFIEAAQLESFEKDFAADPAKRVAQLAVTANGVNKSATDPFVQREDRHQFSIQLETGKITNQKGSGRCWMFAALNTMRVEVMRRLNLETFELSQNYTLFYDKLEKANYFLESILETLDEPTSGRLIAHLLQAPLNDGGQWDMLCNLVEKYGVVPKDAMPETACSSSTWEVTSYMTRKLREFACVLREGHAAGKSAEQLRNQKEVMLCNIYNMLCIAFGNPPKTFTLEVRDKDKKFIRETGLTGKSFYEKYVGWDLSDYVSLINATTADKPFHKTFTVKMLGNIVEGRPVKYLNLPIEDLKAAAIRQMQDNQPVWFGCDVGKCSIREGGIMDLDVLRPDQLFGTEFGMNKAQRLDYGDSLMTHAMVFQGVNLDDNGKPTRWRVENSWGKEPGAEGYYVMSDAWFDEYTYQVVVHKKYLTEAQQAELEQAPIELEPWDPMGSLA